MDQWIVWVLQVCGAFYWWYCSKMLLNLSWNMYGPTAWSSDFFWTFLLSNSDPSLGGFDALQLHLIQLFGVLIQMCFFTVAVKPKQSMRFEYEDSCLCMNAVMLWVFCFPFNVGKSLGLLCIFVCFFISPNVWNRMLCNPSTFFDGFYGFHLW